jgi:hypothetical protein
MDVQSIMAVIQSMVNRGQQNRMVDHAWVSERNRYEFETINQMVADLSTKELNPKMRNVLIANITRALVVLIGDKFNFGQAKDLLGVLLLSLLLYNGNVSYRNTVVPYQLVQISASVRKSSLHLLEDIHNQFPSPQMAQLSVVYLSLVQPTLRVPFLIQ